jgi:hypothetical protein
LDGGWRNEIATGGEERFTRCVDTALGGEAAQVAAQERRAPAFLSKRCSVLEHDSSQAYKQLTMYTATISIVKAKWRAKRAVTLGSSAMEAKSF